MMFSELRCTPSKADRRASRRLVLACSLLGGMLLLAGAPAASGAATLSFGSNLAPAAAKAYPKGADTAFWARSVTGGRATAPAKGRIMSIKLKGCAVQNGAQAPLTQVHFQSLHPRGGNSAQVWLTSGPFNVPICGHGASATTVTTFSTGNLCVHRGDLVAFNDEGGFGPGYPRGVSYKVLAPVAGSTTATFTGANRTNNGNTLAGHALAGTELLMRMTLGTGRNAGVCAAV